jgi:type II secretory pathway predicted ATPase ExeA
VRVEAHRDTGQDEQFDGTDRSVPALFGEPIDARAYVPRVACERALDALSEANRLRMNCALVVGPAGLGKTLLLRVFEARLRAEGTDAHYLPHAALSLPEICHWAVERGDGGPVREEPIEALGRLAQRARSRGGAFHLAIDDANAMPLATARQLGDLVRSLAGGLRLSLVALDDARTSRMLAGLDLAAVEHRFRDPMSIDETREYVAARLRVSGAPGSVLDRFSRDHVDRLHGLSGGNPRQLNRLASEVARGDAGRAILTRIEPGWDDGLFEPARPVERPARSR